MRPLPYLLVLFLTVPLLEIVLLIKVGSLVGLLPTVLLVVGTALLGVFLLRRQGVAVLQRLQHQLADGRLPAAEIVEAVVLLVAGALLLTPGFFTDALGFLLLVPALRRMLIRELAQSRLWRRRAASPSGESPAVIDGECWRDDPR